MNDRTIESCWLSFWQNDDDDGRASEWMDEQEKYWKWIRINWWIYVEIVISWCVVCLFSSSKSSSSSPYLLCHGADLRYRMVRARARTHTARTRMAHNGHCDESISIDVLDREIVAKWQYIRTFVRSVVVRVFHLIFCVDRRSLSAKWISLFRFFSIFCSSSLSSFHSFFSTSSFILLRIFLALPSWRRGNSRCVRFSLMITHLL